MGLEHGSSDSPSACMKPRECSGGVLSLLAPSASIRNDDVIREDEVLSTHVAENPSTGDLGHL